MSVNINDQSSLPEEDRQITLVDEKGNEELFEVLFTFTSDDFNKSYVLLYPAATSDEDDVEIMAFSFDADNEGQATSGDLHEIESDEEWDMVEGVLNTFLDDDEMNGGNQKD